MASDRLPLLSSENYVNKTLEDEDLCYDSFPHNNIPSPDFAACQNTSVNDCDDSQKVKDEQLKVFKRRWYIMVLFSMYAFTQNCVWNTWGPISDTAEKVLGWNDSTIAWLNNWGPISYIMCGLFFPWLVQAKGLRWAVLSSSLLVSFGTTMRVITSESRTATILIHIGQFLNGLGGPIAMGATPHLSATWFAPNERVTATALGTCIGVLGSGFSFIIGPLLVSDQSSSTNSSSNSSTPSSLSDISSTTVLPDPYLSHQKDQIMRYMYYSCGFSWIISLAILLYFPAKPPQPPAVSAYTEREEYWKGLWSLRRKAAFLVIAFTYGISLGVINCWTSVLDVNLKPFGIGESEAGWIGFYSVLGGCAVSLLVGRFADYFTRFMKFFIVVLYLVGTATLVIFAIMLIKIIPFSHVLLYTTVIIATTALNAAVPLLFELACELAYPTSEGAANGFLTYLNNVAGLIFLAIFSVPNIGTMWMNWTVIGSTAVCIPLVGFLRGRFRRMEVDERINPELIAEQEVIVDAAANGNKINA